MTPVLTDPRLIIGLDLPSIDAARAMVERLGATISAYNVGLTLLARAASIEGRSRPMIRRGSVSTGVMASLLGVG